MLYNLFCNAIRIVQPALQSYAFCVLRWHDRTIGVMYLFLETIVLLTGLPTIAINHRNGGTTQGQPLYRELFLGTNYLEFVYDAFWQ